jgi:hypothetical protein
MGSKSGPVNEMSSPPRDLGWSSRALPIFIGAAALMVGTLIYLVARPPEQVYILQKFGQHLSLYGKDANIFGPWAKSLPTFLHVFGFSLITAGLVGGGWISNGVICAGWAGVNVLFELGQKYKETATSYVPAWFEGIPFLENTAPYFQYGSFDPFDLVGALAGASLALLVLFLLRKHGSHQPHQ